MPACAQVKAQQLRGEAASLRGEAGIGGCGGSGYGDGEQAFARPSSVSGDVGGVQEQANSLAAEVVRLQRQITEASDDAERRVRSALAKAEVAAEQCAGVQQER